MTAGKRRSTQGKRGGRKTAAGPRKKSASSQARKGRAAPPARPPDAPPLPAPPSQAPAALERQEPAPPPPEAPVPEAARSALARARGMETLQAAYEAWLELKLEHASARLRLQEEFARLEQQGAFLVGAVRAAGQEAPGDPGLLKAGSAPLEGFLHEAEQKVARAREALAQQQRQTEAFFQEAFAEVRATLQQRVLRYRERMRPGLELVLHPVGTTRTILHAQRVKDDEAVLLCHLLTGRLPSRYGFLLDDSTEDVALPPAPLYPEEGVAPGQVRPDAAALEARVREAGEVLPLKGFLPVFVPRSGGGEDFFRLLQRGPVMEVELAEGPTFRNVLAREEAERLAGHLLRLKLAGHLELDIRAG